MVEIPEVKMYEALAVAIDPVMNGAGTKPRNSCQICYST